MISPGFNFSAYQIDRLRALAKVIDIPPAELARRAIDEYLERVWPLYGAHVAEHENALALHRKRITAIELGERPTYSLEQVKQELEARRVAD